jgi:flagellar biosynthesis protein FlhA
MDPALEQLVESSVQHGEQNSHATLAPPAIRELLQKVNHKVGVPETPVVAIASSGSRYFLRQMVEPTVRNLFFIAHNEVPMEVKIVSLGVIQ